MRIVVLIKPGGELDETDARAVEAALHVARRRIDVSVSVLTAGPKNCVQALRAALALGADDGVHVRDDELATHDVLALSRVYAAALRYAGFELVLCAASSEAPNLSAIPAMLAERLGAPLLARADSLTIGGTDTDEIIAVCDEGGFGGGGGGSGGDGGEGRGWLVERAAEPPVVVSVGDHAPEPRYPPFPAVVEARRKLVRTLTLEDLGVAPDGLRHRSAATAVSNTVLRARTRMILTAGDDPAAAAARLADFLAERQFI